MFNGRTLTALGTALALSLMGLPAAANANGPPASYFRPGVPDYNQRSPGVGSPAHNGTNYCAPTAAANSLAWFDNHGYPDAVPNWSDPDNNNGDPHWLINQMANWMDTSDTGGTLRSDAARGLRQYLSVYSSLKWDVKIQGYGFGGYSVGQIPKGPGVTSPVDINTLKKELSSKEDVLILWGWYYLKPGSNSEFVQKAGGGNKRFGGHAVTADGYTAGGDLLIQDPDGPEGIVEQDPNNPGYYVYSTAANPRLRARLEAIISISPKDNITTENRVEKSEFPDPVNDKKITVSGNTLSTAYDHVYYDAYQVGINFLAADDPAYNSGQINFARAGSSWNMQVNFQPGGEYEINLNGQPLPPQPNPDATIGHPDQPPDPPGFLPVALGVGFDVSDNEPGESSLPPHVQMKLFVQRDVLGDFNIDSFFDISYQLNYPDGTVIADAFLSAPFNPQSVSGDGSASAFDPLEVSPFTEPAYPDEWFDPAKDYTYPTVEPHSRYEYDSLNRLVAVRTAIDPNTNPEWPGWMTGDFDTDEDVDAWDINEQAFHGPTSGMPQLYDLTGDGLYDPADRLFLVENILQTRLGDFDLDMDVDGADYQIWLAHNGQPGDWSAGDADGNWLVDEADWLLWQQFYGFGQDNPDFVPLIPEPATVALLGLLLAPAAGRRARPR